MVIRDLACSHIDQQTTSVLQLVTNNGHAPITAGVSWVLSGKLGYWKDGRLCRKASMDGLSRWSRDKGQLIPVDNGTWEEGIFVGIGMRGEVNVCCFI